MNKLITTHDDMNWTTVSSEYLFRRSWLTAQRELAEETSYTGGRWSLLTVLSPNATSNNNLSYSFLAEGVVKTEGQHLDATEDISVCLLSRDEVLHLLQTDELRQALMAAPLWKYFFMNKN